MKVLRITNEVFERSLPAAAPLLEKMSKEFDSYTEIIIKAYEQTFNCRAYPPGPLRASTDNNDLGQRWTLYFHDELEATAFLLRWA